MKTGIDFELLRRKNSKLCILPETTFNHCTDCGGLLNYTNDHRSSSGDRCICDGCYQKLGQY